MRLHKHGRAIRVTLDRHDVDAFAEQWPGSGMRWGDTCSVTLDAVNGDLLDYTFNGRYPAPERVDEEALRVLTEEANRFAAKRLGRPELHR